MAPRSQEEGDTRAFARLRIMAHTAVTAKIVYTDFVEIGLAIFQMISGLQDLLIEFGTEKKNKKELRHSETKPKKLELRELKLKKFMHFQAVKSKTFGTPGIILLK